MTNIVIHAEDNMTNRDYCQHEPLLCFYLLTWYLMLMTTIGQRIKKARKHCGLTQDELGELCAFNNNNNKGQTRVSNYENDKRSPEIEHLKKIAQAVNVRPEWLILDSGDMLFNSGSGHQLTEKPVEIDLFCNSLELVESYLDKEKIILPANKKAFVVSMLYKERQKGELTDKELKLLIEAIKDSP